MKFPHPIQKMVAEQYIEEVKYWKAKEELDQIIFNARMNQYLETYRFEIVEGKEGEGMSLKAIMKVVSQN